MFGRIPVGVFRNGGLLIRDFSWTFKGAQGESKYSNKTNASDNTNHSM